MRYEVGQREARIQLFEHRARHTGIGDEDIDIADFGLNLGDHRLEGCLGGYISRNGDDDARY